MAAARALAALVHEDVPDSVLSAYGLSSLKFGRRIPHPEAAGSTRFALGGASGGGGSDAERRRAAAA